MQITPLFEMLQIYIHQYVELFITIPSNLKNESTDDANLPKSNYEIHKFELNIFKKFKFSICKLSAVKINSHFIKSNP